MLTNLVCAPQTIDSLFFFSAASFYPGRSNDDSSPFPVDSYHLTDSNDGNTDVDSEGDWLEDPIEPILHGPATKSSSKTTEAMAIEVCSIQLTFCMSWSSHHL